MNVDAGDYKVNVRRDGILIFQINRQVIRNRRTAFFLAPLGRQRVGGPRREGFIFIARSRLIARFRAGFTGLFTYLRRVIATRSRGRIAKVNFRNFLRILRCFLDMRLVRTKLCAAIFLCTNVGRAFYASLAAFGRVYRLIRLFTNMKHATYDASTSSVYDVVRCARFANAFRSVRRFRRLRARANVEFITAMRARNLTPQRAKREFYRIGATSNLRRVFNRALGGKGSVLLFRGARLTICLYGLQLTINARILITRTFRCLRVAIRANRRRRLLRHLQTLKRYVRLSKVRAKECRGIANSFKNEACWRKDFGLRGALAIRVATCFRNRLIARFGIFAGA